MSDQQWTPRIRRIDNEGPERLQYVRSLIREKRVDEARDELLAIIQQNDRSVRAHLMLSSLYQGQGLLAEALDHAQYAITIDPMDAQAHLRAGICSLRMNEVEQAKALLKSAVDIDPKLVAGRVAVARVLSRLGETEAAIAQLEQALRLNPQMAAARLLMSQLLNQSGKPKEAIDELDGFVSANPDHAGATIRLAMLQSRQGNDEKAIALLEAAAKTEPNTGMIWTLLGRLKINSKDYRGAETAFAEAIKLRPQDRTSPLRLVEALVPQGKYNEAREILKKIPSRGRLAGLVHQYYGDIYVGQQLYDQAIGSYKAALLQSEVGEQLLKETEQSIGSDQDAKALVSSFQAAIAKWREGARSRTAERRRQSPVDRPQMATRRRFWGRGADATRTRATRA